MKTGPTDNEETLSDAKQNKQNRNRETASWVFSLLAAVVIAFALRLFIFEFIHVDGPSMQPTLQDEEYVFMEKVTYWFSQPQRGDIIICRFPHSTKSYVKRVIGIGGDTLSIEGGVLYINGNASNDYFSGLMNNDMETIAVPDGYVFVMGDNRNNSTDSRVVGALSLDMVQGKAVFVIWPIGNIGGI